MSCRTCSSGVRVKVTLPCHHPHGVYVVGQLLDDRDERVPQPVEVRGGLRQTGLLADLPNSAGTLRSDQALTVYNWEHGRVQPGKDNLAALVAVRQMGRREALAKLEETLRTKKSR